MTLVNGLRNTHYHFITEKHHCTPVVHDRQGYTQEGTRPVCIMNAYVMQHLPASLRCSWYHQTGLSATAVQIP